MADYENRGDNINEEKDNRLDEENKQRETNPPENTNTDGIAGEHTGYRIRKR